MNRSIGCAITFVSAICLLSFASFQSARAQDDNFRAAVNCSHSVLVQAGDTLSALAGQHLNNLAAYQSIVEATNRAATADASYATIENAAIINIGWKLCIPGETGSPTLIASPTATPTVVPPKVAAPSAPEINIGEEELHPLMIEVMRQKTFPGSDVVIEQNLAPGTNYDRYVASYQSEDNKVFGLLTIPRGQKPPTGWPLILFNHGYIPPAVYRTTERYVAYQDAFARSGYVTFKSDYRGHGNSEGETEGGDRHAAYTTDVLNALASLQRHPDVDPERIGMWGHSMGGQITLRAMVISDEIKAGVIWAGTVANYATMYEQWQERARVSPTWSERTRRWREELIGQHGTPAENPAFWAAISPNSYVSDLSGPILLQHATGDATVPVAYSDTLNAEIKAVGGNVEYIRYNGDNHNMSVNLSAALAQAVSFFDKNVK